ncbi:PREDICTED: uncharacterized protein LOC105369055 [Ceratosolen solmsi marchali]|uniref:Uncharacterized protein LOC105369055 n=1 Tax=Ceratosolen solmsi marchali TaxID=326594 RepID=A0AAJ6YYA7_9HYME|nr:PREDICTED: uncharacterized protein LOC105369055 [Ceratosolen solmsi marchali]
MSLTNTDEQKKYEILRNEQVGRYAVAIKNLEPGEEVMSELPFVVGPKSFTHPLCLSCYSPWPSELDNQFLCSTCCWPVCSTECEVQPQHKDYECGIFAESKEKFNVEVALCNEQQNGIPQLECITPLRLLLASEKDDERWKREVKDMETHNKNRCQKSQWSTDHVNIVEYLRKRLKLERFSEDNIQSACGILEINCYEIRTAKGFLARALYPNVAIISHSCVSNTVHSVVPADYRIARFVYHQQCTPSCYPTIHLRTAVKVSAGQELFSSYTHALLPTMLRREYLLESKYFVCACSRCADPTELGTHMSSLKCNKCDNGMVVPLDSLDTESRWKCTHCEFSTNGQAVNKVQKIIQGEMDKVEVYTIADGPEAVNIRENFIKKYSLSQLYGHVNEYYLDDLPDVVLEHKVDICRLLLQVLDVVEPGLTRSRGMVLYELHAPLLFLAKNLWNADVIDAAALKSKMIEAASILKEAANILLLEPKGTAEAEDALAVGPAIFEKSVFCFACMRALPVNYKAIKYTCSECNVAPLCSLVCQNTNGLHSSHECNIFQEKKYLCLENLEKLVQILLHFRLWIFKNNNSEAWNQILNMEAHISERRNTTVWEDCEENIINVFRVLSLLNADDDGESLQWLCGVVDVNTFELRSPGVVGTADTSPHLLRGFFPEASLMSHACRATAHVSVDESFRMSVYAAVSIKAGEAISFNYTSCLLGSIARQQHLQEGKYFRCDCAVCKDPLEGGSYISCILCPRCKEDYVAIQNPKENDPYGYKTKWQCQKCKRIFFGCLIKRTLDISKDLISQLDINNYKEIEKLLEKLSRSFHKNHFILLSLKQELLSVYRKELTNINPQKKILKRMLQLYDELIDVLEIVEPGISRLKGIVLYEMHLSNAILANRAYNAREISSEELCSRLEIAQGHLKRSLTMLLLEPVNTPEGALAKRALRNKKLLAQNIENVKSILQ